MMPQVVPSLWVSAEGLQLFLGAEAPIPSSSALNSAFMARKATAAALMVSSVLQNAILTKPSDAPASVDSVEKNGLAGMQSTPFSSAIH